jgi:hypothetical protein
MKLFYIDESGTGLKDQASSFFVLAALGAGPYPLKSLSPRLLSSRAQCAHLAGARVSARYRSPYSPGHLTIYILAHEHRDVKRQNLYNFQLPSPNCAP